MDTEIVYLGERIALRRFRLADAEALWNSIENPVVNRLTGSHGTFTREMIDRYIANQVAGDDDSRASFVICSPDADALAVGEVVINDIDPDNRSANIRIALFDEAHFGKGYGSEAMRLMVAHGFCELKLHRISLGVYAFNPRAIHVYEKIGFKREGAVRDALLWDGEYTDEIIMGILEDEWRDGS